MRKSTGRIIYLGKIRLCGQSEKSVRHKITNKPFFLPRRKSGFYANQLVNYNKSGINLVKIG